MSQAGVSAETRELADRLVALEAATGHISQEDEYSTCRVCEKLRRPLSILAGRAGFASLLTRALTLATREAPALGTVQVDVDGAMMGLEGEAAKASPVLIACLLHLLSTFIGEALVLQLLLDVWPDLPIPDAAFPRKDAK